MGGREYALQAAVRELAEELGLRMAHQELVDPWQITEAWARGKNTVTIFTLREASDPVSASTALSWWKPTG